MPTRTLPLLEPLRDIGVPDELVDVVEKPVRTVVDSAYDRAPHENGGATVDSASATPISLDASLNIYFLRSGTTTSPASVTSEPEKVTGDPEPVKKDSQPVKNDSAPVDTNRDVGLRDSLRDRVETRRAEREIKRAEREAKRAERKAQRDVKREAQREAKESGDSGE